MGSLAMSPPLPTCAGRPSRSMDAPQAGAWGFVLRNRVPPFSHHSRGAIFRRWRKLPTIRMRRRNPRGAASPSPRAIRPSIRRRTPRGRRAPRRRGRICRRPTRRSPNCSIPASARAPRGRARRPASSRRRTIRSTAAPISPPRTGRANRRRGIRRGAAGGLCRQGTGTVGRDAGRAWSSELAQALGFEPRRRGRCRRRGQERHHDVPRHHRRLRHRARAGDAAARGPPGIRRAAVDAAPPAAAGEIRRRPAAGDPIGFRAQGRPADRRSPTWSKACGARTAPRCCWASPAPARPSPWPR